MKKLSLALAALALLATPSIALADAIPYANKGTVNPTVYNFVAGFDGDIWGYFIGGDAEFGSMTNMSIAGGAYNPPDPGTFQNHSTLVGAEVLFASGVTAGDTIDLKLSVSILNPLGPPVLSFELFSNPLSNPDLNNRVYATAYTGSIGDCDEAGANCTYIGWEDKLVGSDWDYNDHQFVFKGVSTNDVPDGGSALALLGVALTGLGVMRRRLS